MREPRSETIFRHARAALTTDGQLTERVYAQRVADDYNTTVPLHLRTVEFHAGNTADTVEAAQRANAQIVRRFMSGEVRAPMDLEESFVAALPPLFRERCKSDLSARYGLLAAPMPTNNASEQTARVADLLQQSGEAVAALAPMLADGVINAADRPHAVRALQELTDVQAAVACLSAQIVNVLEPAIPGNVSPMRRSA